MEQEKIMTNASPVQLKTAKNAPQTRIHARYAKTHSNCMKICAIPIVQRAREKMALSVKNAASSSAQNAMNQ